MASVGFVTPTTLAHVRANLRTLQTFYDLAQADGGNLAAAAALKGFNIGGRVVTAGHTVAGTLAADRLRRRLIVPRLVPPGTLQNDRFDYTKIYALRAPTAGKIRVFGSRAGTLKTGLSTGAIPVVFTTAGHTDAGVQETLAAPLRLVVEVVAETAPPCPSRYVAFIRGAVTTSGFTVIWTTGGAAEALTSDWQIVLVYHLLASKA